MTWLLDAAIKFSKKIIAVIFILMILFTITMIVVYLVTGAVPDTLVQEFFGFFKVEGGCLAGIKVADTIVSWFKKRMKAQPRKKHPRNMKKASLLAQSNRRRRNL